MVRPNFAGPAFRREAPASRADVRVTSDVEPERFGEVLGDVDPATSYRSDASVTVAQGDLTEDELMVSWDREPHGQLRGGRAFSAELAAATDKLNGIHRLLRARVLAYGCREPDVRDRA